MRTPAFVRGGIPYSPEGTQDLRYPTLRRSMGPEIPYPQKNMGPEIPYSPEGT